MKNRKSTSSSSSKGTRLKPYEDLSAAGIKRRLSKVAGLAIAEYALDVRELSYMTEETNLFFKVIDHRGQIYAMKMYQEESSTLEDNMAEMVFLKQLESVKDIRVPKIISTKDGNRVVVINSSYTPTPKRVILYRWMEGEDLAKHETVDRFFQAGELMAKLHDATHAFKLPESVRPKKWDQVFYFHDEKAVYHEKKYAKLIRPDEIELLDQVIPFLNHHLASYYQMSSPQLIHGDFNPWNLLVDEDAMKVIDFDDAQLGYPIFDLAIFLFYYRYDESFDYQQVKKTVLAGYQSVRPLPAFTEFEIELLMTARRVNFVNYVLYMNEEMGEYITNSCNRIREFLKTYDSDLKV